MRPVRVRIAAPPPRYLRVGSARSTRFNCPFVRQRHGAFVLRMEDTDVERNRAEDTEAIQWALRWPSLDALGPQCSLTRLRVAFAKMGASRGG